jgi:glycosyltransferase involved in cell wall biosynthesis
MALRVKKKVLLIENSSIDFYKARLPFAKYLIQEGYIITALIPQGDYIKQIESENIEVITYDLFRNNKNLLKLIKLVLFYYKVINLNNYDIIHSFRFQPNLISVISNVFNKKKIIVHITGLGIVFSNNTLKYKLLKFISQICYQIIFFRANVIILQNNEDKNEFWLIKIWLKKFHIILGSGVDTNKFDRSKYNKNDLRQLYNFKKTDLVFVIITRLIWEKGIKELTDAFMVLNSINENIKLLIAGWSDQENPRSIKLEFIESFQDVDFINFVGKIDNVEEILALSDCFIFPSYYREGVPRCLLEALSMSLPIITTNMPGCNVTVVDSYNGYLIKPMMVNEIISTVSKLITEDNFILFGQNSNLLAEKKFSNSIIFYKISKLYN